MGDARDVVNRIPQHDTMARREKLVEISRLGLRHMEDKKIKTTLLGHEIVLQDAAANLATAVTWAEDLGQGGCQGPSIRLSCHGRRLSPPAPPLKNPSADEAANQDGFTAVVSKLRYYLAMEKLLLPKDIPVDLRSDLTERLVDLYKRIISFQLRSVVRFYRSRTKNYLRATIKYDGWEKKLEAITKAESDLVSKFEGAIRGMHFDLAQSNLQELKALGCDGRGLTESSRQLGPHDARPAQHLGEDRPTHHGPPGSRLSTASPSYRSPPR